MSGLVPEHLKKQLAEIRAAGLFKSERVITTPQGARVRVELPVVPREEEG